MENFDENNLGEYPTLAIGSGKYKTELTRKFEKRVNWVAPNPNDIKAVIPGTIIDVYVKPGQKVKKGEIILVLEAMKMQNQILMPFDGKIKTIHVKPEERVSKNQLMIELA